MRPCELSQCEGKRLSIFQWWPTAGTTATTLGGTHASRRREPGNYFTLHYVLLKKRASHPATEGRLAPERWLRGILVQ